MRYGLLPSEWPTIHERHEVLRDCGFAVPIRPFPVVSPVEASDHPSYGDEPEVLYPGCAWAQDRLGAPASPIPRRVRRQAPRRAEPRVIWQEVIESTETLPDTPQPGPRPTWAELWAALRGSVMPQAFHFLSEHPEVDVRVYWAATAEQMYRALGPES